MPYIVYFEIFGKKMKVKIDVDSEDEAEQYIKDKIKFHKVQLEEKDFIGDSDIFNNLKNTMGI